MTRVLALVFCMAALPSALHAQSIKRTPQAANKLELLGVSVPMRDGIRLVADVFLPKSTGRWPTVLFRTPYGRKGPSSRSYRSFVQRGYAVVLEDVRGRIPSQGVFGTIDQEGPDGSDTINWIAGQRWSDGKVAMAGASYLGMVQWWAAVQQNPHLRAISPSFCGDDEYLDRFYSTGGAMKLGHRLLWLSENLTPPQQLRPLFSTYISHVPLVTSDVAATGIKLRVWRAAVEHPSYDAYWKTHSIREQISRIDTPALVFGGWFDNYAQSDLDLFSQLSAARKPIEAWIGPWGHNPSLKFPTRDFGPETLLPMRSMQTAWFDHWLNPSATTPAGEAEEHSRNNLHLFVMGPNVWREEHEWPLSRTHFTPFYLSSNGHANTREGDGVLSREPVRKTPHDAFVYDPKSPVPTVGGPICCEPKIFPPGPLDQATVEERPDVLVYTSPPLAEDVEVTGFIKALLYVSTSANDTDFTAKLVDVEKDGKPLSVTDGVLRLRYRLSLEKPVFVKRNNAYQITIDAGVTSYVFSAGHRIRLEVSSSNFPRFDRNMNSSASNAGVTKMAKAKQSVFHEKDYPSALILPIIPIHGHSNVHFARISHPHKAVTHPLQ
jgi:uncharacterized protein